MKGYMELALGAILLVLMYEKPHALTEFANSLLGKAVMIIGVGIIAKNNGLAPGLLAALIMIILMHETIEGMTGKIKDKAKKDKVKESKKHVSFQVPSNVQPEIDAILKGKCQEGGSCGYAKTKCESGGTCKIRITPSPVLEDEKAKESNKESFTDVRITEGFRNREAYQNTIESMKFSNGQTGAGQNRYNQF
jgi:hypothetical protein